MTAGYETLDFHDFHRVELPRRLNAGNGAIAARDVEKHGVLAIQLEEGGDTVTVFFSFLFTFFFFSFFVNYLLSFLSFFYGFLLFPPF